MGVSDVDAAGKIFREGGCMEEMIEKETIKMAVSQTVALHPVGIVVNLLMTGVFFAGLYGFFFDNKAFYGVAIFVGSAAIIRLAVISILKAYMVRQFMKRIKE